MDKILRTRKTYVFKLNHNEICEAITDYIYKKRGEVQDHLMEHSWIEVDGTSSSLMKFDYVIDICNDEAVDKG